MAQTWKGIGYAVIGVGALAGMFVLALLVAGLWVKGAVWVSAKLYPWLLALNGFTFALTLFVLLPSAIFPSTPRFAGGGMFVASYVFGATLWVWSLLLTYMLWGGVGLVIGLFLAGVGVVPLAMVATLVNGMWSDLGQLALGVGLVFGARLWGARLLEKSAAPLEPRDSMEERDGDAPKTCPACGLISPASTRKCDCGFDFSSGRLGSARIGPEGIRGWLIFVAVGLSTAPGFLLVALFNQLRALPGIGLLSKADHPYYSPWWFH